MLKRFLYWWNNPKQKESKTKKEKPLTWRQEMEVRRLEIIKEAKLKKRNSKKGIDDADAMFVVFLLLLLLPISLFVVWWSIDTSDKETKRSACDSVGGSLEVVDTTFINNMVVEIYGCVK